MTKSTISITLEGALNALAKNKDGTQFAVAGRSVFKILYINEEKQKFTELINMRVGKNLNLNSSCNDVVWSSIDPNLLATGATNGAVVTWNLNKSSRNKMDIVFQDHKRTVNKICFHPNESSMLLSGSQDGTMKLFDLRQRKGATLTFLSQSESVRDVQFSKFHDYYFSSVQENGNVQIWDLRKNDHHEKQFTAHSGPVFSCDWHLEDSRYLATGGRDKTIKIWDISTVKPHLENCIQTIASVSRIKWRPQQKTHIASSSLVVDFTIYIWDYLRPFVSFATLQEHKDVVTDFVWRDTAANILISVGKDGTVYYYSITEAERPALKANPCGLDMNNHGDIFSAMSNLIIKDNKNNLNLNNSIQDKNGKENGNIYLQNTNDPNNLTPYFNVNAQSAINNSNNNSNFSSSTLTSSSATTFMKRSISTMFQNNVTNNNLNQAHSSQNNAQLNTYNLKPFTSSAMFFKNNGLCKAITLDWFVESAYNYELSGKSITDLFEHNACVAEKLNRLQVAQTWRILKQLYMGTKEIKPQFNTSSKQTNNSNTNRETNVSNSNLLQNNESRNLRCSLPQVETNLSLTSLLNNSASNEVLYSDKDKLEFKNCNSGQQSRHTSGNNHLASPVTPNVISTASNLANNAIANPPIVLSTSANLRTNVNSNIQNNNALPRRSISTNKSLSNTTKNNDSDSSTEIPETGLTTPVDKDFRRGEPQDFFFGDGVVIDTHNLTSYDVTTNEIVTELDDFSNIFDVPREAFDLRHPIQEFEMPPDLDMVNNDSSALNLIEEEIIEENYNSNKFNSNQFKLDINSCLVLSAEIPPNPQFKFADIVVDMLKFYANQGDVQTSVSVLIILGEKLKSAVDIATQEHWFNSYIELLSKFQLWNTINQVIKLSVLPSINSLNQLSTTIYTSCANCNKQLKNNKVAWLCDCCKKVSSNCSICHEVVKGIYVWCQGCSHGGHINHLKQWFNENKYCPTGCGHLCEYN